MKGYSRKEIDGSKVLVTLTTDLAGLAAMMRESSNGVLLFAKTVGYDDPEKFDANDFLIELQFACKENCENKWGDKRHEIMGLKQIVISEKE